MFTGVSTIQLGIKRILPGGNSAYAMYDISRPGEVKMYLVLTWG
jgi:hypothetical protein